MPPCGVGPSLRQASGEMYGTSVDSIMTAPPAAPPQELEALSIQPDAWRRPSISFRAPLTGRAAAARAGGSQPRRSPRSSIGGSSYAGEASFAAMVAVGEERASPLRLRTGRRADRWTSYASDELFLGYVSIWARSVRSGARAGSARARLGGPHGPVLVVSPQRRG